ncbi:MAG: hypothetical protein JO170_01725 [Verrucomicrobia bacterium]|nr:hypothetical protein [Verrucomicrobiota bacterium]
MFGGGRGANCAVAAARAGCQVKFVGGRGKDMFGQMAIERLARDQNSTPNAETNCKDVSRGRMGVWPLSRFPTARHGEPYRHGAGYTRLRSVYYLCFGLKFESRPELHN